MRDEEEERKRKGKQRRDEMDDGGKRARTSTCFRCHRTPCVCPQFLGNRDNRGENAPPSAPVVNQPHGLRRMGQQSGVPSRFSSNPRQFVVQQPQLEQLEQRGQFASASAQQEIQIPGNNPPQYSSEAMTAAQKQLWDMAAACWYRPFTPIGAQQQQRLHQIMAEVADLAGIPPHAYQTNSTTGAQLQQLQADTPPVGAARGGRPEIPGLNLQPPEVHPPAARAAAPNAREDGNPGQNAAPPRLDIQTHPTPRQPGGVVLGGLQEKAPRPPSPMARRPACISARPGIRPPQSPHQQNLGLDLNFIHSVLGNQDNPGENAPLPVPAVDNQPHGRPMEQQSGVAPRNRPQRRVSGAGGPRRRMATRTTAAPRTRRVRRAYVHPGAVLGIGGSTSSSHDPEIQGQARGSGIRRPPSKLRECELNDISVTNKALLAATGGKKPEWVLRPSPPTAAEMEMEMERRLQAFRQDMASKPVPARRVARPTAACQRTVSPGTGIKTPEVTAEPRPEPQIQPDCSCPRCRVRDGTVAPHHMCRCAQCSDYGEPCPFCSLEAVPREQQRRGMCPHCGATPGKVVVEHVCVCDGCPTEFCPSCKLAKLSRPQPRPHGSCPCCLQSAGRAIRHLCLCDECKRVPGSECPFCILAELPSGLRPFEFLKRVAFAVLEQCRG